MEFGKYIENLMISKGWTTAELARRTGISRTYLVMVMAGNNTTTGRPPEISITKLLSLSKTLNVHPMKLIRAYEGNDPDSGQDSFVVDDEILLEAFREFLRSRTKR